MGKYFFEIPIFRCTLDQFWEENNLDLQKRIEYIKSRNKDIADKLTAINFDYEKVARMGLDQSLYHYKELVGMIRLFAITGQIRGELYYLDNRISRVLKNKRWSLKEGKIFELWVRRSDTNELIYKRILKYISDYQLASKALKKRNIDITCFQAVGEKIDFISLSL